MAGRLKTAVHHLLPITLIILTVPDFLNALFFMSLEYDSGVRRFFRSLAYMTFSLELLTAVLCIVWVVFIIAEGGGFAAITGRRYGSGRHPSLKTYGVAFVLFILSMYLKARYGDFMVIPPMDVFEP